MNPTMIWIASAALGATHADGGGQRMLVLSVSNVDCHGCETPITEALEQAQGVVSLELDTDRQRVIVLYERSLTDSWAIATAVDEAGYHARRVADAEIVEILPAPPRGCTAPSSRRDPRRGVIHGRSPHACSVP